MIRVTARVRLADANDLENKLSKIRLIASDIDGVLTDGKITMDDQRREIRNFHVLDGMGLRLAKEFGLELVFISGRFSAAVSERLKDLGIEHVYQEVDHKGPFLERILVERRLKREAVCAVGDDLSDLPLFHRSGVAVAVSNAVNEVKEAAQWTTTRCGGDGALREIVDGILKAKGLWPKVMARFSR